MKQDKASGTAETVARWRATESLNPKNIRVCYDPLAKHFLSGMYRFIINWKILRKLGIWYADCIAPGAYGEVVARTRYIDNYLKTCIQNGIEQLVILGDYWEKQEKRRGTFQSPFKNYPECSLLKIFKTHPHSHCG